jgi:hypothetical protein
MPDIGGGQEVRRAGTQKDMHGQGLIIASIGLPQLKSAAIDRFTSTCFWSLIIDNLVAVHNSHEGEHVL